MMPPLWVVAVPRAEDYLKRLGVDEVREPSLDALRELHLAHLVSVPFENLDIGRGIEIVLDESRILSKLLVEGRGGFCYELNGAFAWLLRELGYRVALLSAEVAGKEGAFGIPFDHMTLRVDLDRPYLADVGFGDSFREPLPLEEGAESSQADGIFRVVQDPPWWILERSLKIENAFSPQYRFTLTPRQLDDFEPACRYHQTSPDSSFTHGPVCTRALPEGRITLHRDRLVVRSAGRRTETAVRTMNEWHRLLKRRFGIRLREPAHARSEE